MIYFLTINNLDLIRLLFIRQNDILEVFFRDVYFDLDS